MNADGVDTISVEVCFVSANHAEHGQLVGELLELIQRFVREREVPVTVTRYDVDEHGPDPSYVWHYPSGLNHAFVGGGERLMSWFDDEGIEKAW